uniref:G_PROTEIN_RECEP_F1_2 domain-containing protein n=1 Tax=Caenorhabditis tropicalis TaxID=1561998 RepID=A0A1I7V2J7_9PELO
MVLAISVIIRSLTSLIVNIILSIAHRKLPIYNISLSIWLYVDYCTGYFSNILIFFMSLNRCLCFVKRHWGEAIFEGKRICLPILISVVLSVASAIVSIRSSGIRRLVIDGAGFVDWGEPEGLKMIMALIFEILYFLDRISAISIGITLIAVVNIVNYLPEISLPFLIILNTLRPIRRVSVMVAGSQTQSQVSGRRK